MPAPLQQVRCPGATCGAVFAVDERRLGRNVYCLECGARMTARPVEIEAQLHEREDAHAGGSASGASIERLPLVAVIDNVRSLWNVGSIFRSADACGVEELILTGITGTPPRDEIRKTALGADEAVAWSYRADSLDAVRQQAAAGYRPVIVEAAGDAVPIDQITWPDRACLVVGNEVAGVSPRVLGVPAVQVAIPMLGVKQSLNVAVAFGIAAFQASRALRQRGVMIR